MYDTSSRERSTITNEKSNKRLIICRRSLLMTRIILSYEIIIRVNYSLI